MDELDSALSVMDTWGAGHAAGCVVLADGRRISRGDLAHRFRWASVTKLATSVSVLIAADRGLIDLDEPAGPPGATVRHLLAHASGLPFEGETPIAPPGRRRIYSNSGYDALGTLVGERAGGPFGTVLRDWVLTPLGMTGTELVERPSDGLYGAIDGAAALASEYLRPSLVPDALIEATVVAFPGLVGVVPGVGRFDPCDWGLGPEIHGSKSPHWMGARNSSRTFGHFGGSGSFLWVDPAAKLAFVALTDRDYGPWALSAWPDLSDRIIEAASTRD